MFVEVVIVKTDDGRLEDVRRRCRTPRVAPTTRPGVEVQCGLGLCAGEAELAGRRQVPGRRIPSQRAKPLCYLGFGDPLDAALAPREPLDLVGRHELGSARTVRADMPQQRERIAGGHLVAARPPVEHLLVVGQEAPEERPHHAVAVLPLG
jgi:hypothetical protein